MIHSDLLPELTGFIDGHWGPQTAGASLEIRNPATGELLARVPDMAGDETHRAIEAAVRAQETRADLQQRRSWLTDIARLIDENKSEIGRIVTLENGKPLREGEGEAAYAAGFYRYAADHIDELQPRTLEETPRDLRWTVHYRPAGVAALITPWNFPFAMVAKKLSSALAADCAVVVKPSEKTPLSMIAMFELLRRVGLPRGRANLVIGNPAPIGKVICEHPEVSVISFTGSTAVGRMLLAETATQVKRLALELGGNAPFIVFEDSDPRMAAHELVQNKLRASGQTCVCTNRVLVHRSIANNFTEALLEKLDGLRSGDGMDPATDLGPLIDRAGYDKVRTHVADAISAGATRVLGDDLPLRSDDFGFFVRPVVLRSVNLDMACTREETFGPLFPILEFGNEDEAVRWANQTEFGLAAYVFSGDPERGRQVAARLRYGHVGVNTATGPTPEAPFGGMKQSGLGREGGSEGLMEFIEVQTVPEP